MTAKEKILAIITEQYGEEPAPDSLLQDDMLFDSLDAVELVVEVEENFDVSISDVDFDRACTECKTVAGLIAFVEKAVTT